MAEISSCPPLTRDSVRAAHERIKHHIHRTPVVTCQTLTNIASQPRTAEELHGTDWEGQSPAKPKIRLYFKCENHQKIGAFKARGAFHALSRLSKEELARGVVTHSSGKPVHFPLYFCRHCQRYESLLSPSSHRTTTISTASI